MKSVAAKEQKEPREGNMGESEWGGEGRQRPDHDGGSLSQQREKG